MRIGHRKLVGECLKSGGKSVPLADETRNRKRLRPNEIAAWEMRAGRFRVFYNVSDDELDDDASAVVRIEAVGFKVGNLLHIRHERREL